jgi:hypothetical protein
MSITRVSDFSENSFAFEDSVRNMHKFGSRKIGLVAEDGGPLLLKLENCLAYGINKNNKFAKDNYAILLSVGTHTEFVSALETVEKKCAAAVGKHDTNVLRCFYRSGRQPVLYAKIEPEYGDIQGGWERGHKSEEGARRTLLPGCFD